MKHHKRPISLLIVGIISFFTLASLIYFFSPAINLMLPQTQETFLINKYIHLSPVILFLILTGITFFCLGSYFLKSKANGILVTSFVIAYLLFRLNHLNHPFFLILLVALFLVLELFISSRK